MSHAADILLGMFMLTLALSAHWADKEGKKAHAARQERASDPDYYHAGMAWYRETFGGEND